MTWSCIHILYRNNVNFLVLILHSNYVRCSHGGKWGEGYTGPLCTIACNFLCICNFFQNKTFKKKLYYSRLPCHRIISDWLPHSFPLKRSLLPELRGHSITNCLGRCSSSTTYAFILLFQRLSFRRVWQPHPHGFDPRSPLEAWLQKEEKSFHSSKVLMLAEDGPCCGKFKSLGTKLLPDTGRKCGVVEKTLVWMLEA